MNWILRCVPRLLRFEAQVALRYLISGSGQNQRRAVVRALANSPKIVLADEPTGNLDRHSGQEVFNLMREMNRESGIAFLMITHDERLAQAADRILLIEDGLLRQV